MSEVVIRRSGTPGPGSEVLQPLVDDAQAAAAAAQGWAESDTAPNPDDPSSKSSKTYAAAAAAAAAAAQGWANFRAVMADAITDFAVGTYFVSIDTGAVTAHPNTARLYLRTNTSPFYADQGDAAAPLTKAQLDLIFDSQVTAKQFGLKGDGATDDQAASLALMASPFKVIRFTPGLYKCGVANATSNRTLIFDEGAIIDGTIHAAVGSGPDITEGASEITWVDNVRIIGCATTTTRLGTYYCRKVNVDKIRVTEIDPSYTGQTAAGGSNGVHLYLGTKDFRCGEIICDSTTDGNYALGIDISTTQGPDQYPENIHVGRLIVRNNTQSVLSTVKTINVTIDEIVADSWDNFVGFGCNGDTNLRIGKLTASGAPTAANQDGIYLQNGTYSFGEVEISGTTQIGFRTLNCTRVDAGTIRSHNNALDQCRLESPGRIGRIETSGAGTGSAVLIQNNGNGVSIGEIVDTAGGGVTVTSDDVTIERLTSTGNTTSGKSGLFLNGADRFQNRFLNVDGNNRGMTLTNIADPTFGAMRVANSVNGIVGSGVTGLSYGSVTYSGNTTYDTNLTLNGVPGFRGSRVRTGVVALTDADATLTMPSAPTQLCAVPLTANRAVTLSTTGASNGDRFRIARTAASTGAFNLAVSGILGLGTVNLATSQFLEVEFLAPGWQMTAKGSLT